MNDFGGERVWRLRAQVGGWRSSAAGGVEAAGPIGFSAGCTRVGPSATRFSRAFCRRWCVIGSLAQGGEQCVTWSDDIM